MKKAIFCFVTMFFCTGLWGNNINKKLDKTLLQFQKIIGNIDDSIISIEKGDGSLSWTGSREGIDKNSSIFIASITKLYTATVTLKLYEEGKIKLDDPIDKYLDKELIKGFNENITIHHLLSHTSGLPDYYDEKVGDKTGFEIFLEDIDKKWTVNDTIAWSREKQEILSEPGKDCHYSDTNFQLLGKIIEKVTDNTLSEAYKKYIFDPLNLNNTWLIGFPYKKDNKKPLEIKHNNIDITNVRYNGAYWADGGIISTTEELILFYKSLNQGLLISYDNLQLMRNWNKMSFPFSYGYGTMLVEIPMMPQLIGHSGSSGAFLYYCQDSDVYIAGSLNLTGSGELTFKIMSELINIVGK